MLPVRSCRGVSLSRIESNGLYLYSCEQKGNVQRTRRVISDDIIVRGSDARDDKREDDMKDDDKGERDIRQGLDIL